MYTLRMKRWYQAPALYILFIIIIFYVLFSFVLFYFVLYYVCVLYLLALFLRSRIYCVYREHRCPYEQYCSSSNPILCVCMCSCNDLVRVCFQSAVCSCVTGCVGKPNMYAAIVLMVLLCAALCWTNYI